MSAPRYKDVELPRIKRKSNSWEGKVIEYLLNHPSNKAATEFSMEALTAFWLPEALEGQVSSEELSLACWSAIEKLEGKLATIRRIAGIKKLPSSDTTLFSASPETVNPTKNNENLNDDEIQVSTSDDDDQTLDEDSDDLMELELSPEMKQINKLFGVE